MAVSREIVTLPYCDNKKIIFLHIPKTGGTTVGSLFDILQFQDSDPETTPTPQHLTCSMLRERLGVEKYYEYYKFTFVRNPWARILSSYYWRQTLKKKRPILPFEEFVENVKKVVNNRLYYQQEFGDHFIPQIEYTWDVDDIFRFENFAADVYTLAEKLGIVIEQLHPKTPKHYDNYWEFYNQRSRSVIADVYKEEIARFGYEFDPGSDGSARMID